MKLDKSKVQIKMAKLCINQPELAKRANISRQTLSYVMNGRNCRPEVVGKICKALNVEPEEIVE